MMVGGGTRRDGNPSERRKSALASDVPWPVPTVIEKEDRRWGVKIGPEGGSVGRWPLT
jgi:hypothetical protein